MSETVTTPEEDIKDLAQWRKAAEELVAATQRQVLHDAVGEGRTVLDALRALGVVVDPAAPLEFHRDEAQRQRCFSFALRWHLVEVLFGLVELIADTPSPTLPVAETAETRSGLSAESTQPAAAVDPVVQQRLRRFVTPTDQRRVAAGLRLVIEQAPILALLQGLYPLMWHAEADAAPQETEGQANPVGVGLRTAQKRRLVAAMLSQVVVREDGLRAAIGAFVTSDKIPPTDAVDAAQRVAAALATPPAHVLASDAADTTTIAIRAATDAERTQYLETVCRQFGAVSAWRLPPRDGDTSGRTQQYDARLHVFMTVLALRLMRPPGNHRAAVDKPRLAIVNRAWLGPGFAVLRCQRPSRSAAEVFEAVLRVNNMAQGASRGAGAATVPFTVVWDAVCGGVMRLLVAPLPAVLPEGATSPTGAVMTADVTLRVVRETFAEVFAKDTPAPLQASAAGALLRALLAAHGHTTATTATAAATAVGTSATAAVTHRFVVDPTTGAVVIEAADGPQDGAEAVTDDATNAGALSSSFFAAVDAMKLDGLVAALFDKAVGAARLLRKSGAAGSGAAAALVIANEMLEAFGWLRCFDGAVSRLLRFLAWFVGLGPSAAAVAVGLLPTVTTAALVDVPPADLPLVLQDLRDITQAVGEVRESEEKAAVVAHGEALVRHSESAVAGLVAPSPITPAAGTGSRMEGQERVAMLERDYGQAATLVRAHLVSQQRSLLGAVLGDVEAMLRRDSASAVESRAGGGYLRNVPSDPDDALRRAADSTLGPLAQASCQALAACGDAFVAAVAAQVFALLCLLRLDGSADCSASALLLRPVLDTPKADPSVLVAKARVLDAILFIAEADAEGQTIRRLLFTAHARPQAPQPQTQAPAQAPAGTYSMKLAPAPPISGTVPGAVPDARTVETTPFRAPASLLTASQQAARLGRGAADSAPTAREPPRLVESVTALCRAAATAPLRIAALHTLGAVYCALPAMCSVPAMCTLVTDVFRGAADVPGDAHGCMTRAACAALVSQLAHGVVHPASTEPATFKQFLELTQHLASFRAAPPTDAPAPTTSAPRGRPLSAADALARQRQEEDEAARIAAASADAAELVQEHGRRAREALMRSASELEAQPARDPEAGADDAARVVMLNRGSGAVGAAQWASHPLNLWRDGTPRSTHFQIKPAE